MKQVKILGIVFMLVGVVAIFIGTYFSASKKENDYMENVNINIKRLKCLDSICTSELFIRKYKMEQEVKCIKITNKKDTSTSKRRNHS